ncbi:hypothetical protein AURANDRAFT_61632 [Aureococcus anophagefferens]|uniref:Uncharacterized protein n=1 Tax=Aureococcus anophagefferens TaxID=44056 RepID=F0Y0T4_AURAN|nr:hypothetical protein AURANDRAFT_61632 [Aureococcus anophagefferens]EGB11272.1 hypothetical protein AURANDRAFT_61632 [Aureococcus anophagefferens]|eukprot:XP_009033657.1 hypothetical protein AURANDRAFT_61632 [Aureococcus anophagefferens]
MAKKKKGGKKRGGGDAGSATAADTGGDAGSTAAEDTGMSEFFEDHPLKPGQQYLPKDRDPAKRARRAELVLYAERELEALRARQGGRLTAEQRTDKWQLDFRLKCFREKMKVDDAPTDVPQFAIAPALCDEMVASLHAQLFDGDHVYLVNGRSKTFETLAELERCKVRANLSFGAGDWAGAVDGYSAVLAVLGRAGRREERAPADEPFYGPTLATTYANRAAALLRVADHASAVRDCLDALRLPALHDAPAVKAKVLRRLEASQKPPSEAALAAARERKRAAKPRPAPDAAEVDLLVQASREHPAAKPLARETAERLVALCGGFPGAMTVMSLYAADNPYAEKRALARNVLGHGSAVVDEADLDELEGFFDGAAERRLAREAEKRENAAKRDEALAAEMALALDCAEVFWRKLGEANEGADCGDPETSERARHAARLVAGAVEPPAGVEPPLVGAPAPAERAPPTPPSLETLAADRLAAAGVDRGALRAAGVPDAATAATPKAAAPESRQAKLATSAAMYAEKEAAERGKAALAAAVPDDDVRPNTLNESADFRREALARKRQEAFLASSAHCGQVVDDLWHVSLVAGAGSSAALHPAAARMLPMSRAAEFRPPRYEVCAAPVPRPAPRDVRGSVFGARPAADRVDLPPPLASRHFDDDHASDARDVALRLVLLEAARLRGGVPKTLVFGPCGALELSGVVRLRSRFVDDFVRGVLRVGAFRLEGWIEGSMGGPTLNWGTFDDAAHDRAAERRRREARGDGGEAEAAFVCQLNQKP